MTIEQFYDQTSAVAWHLARCLHGSTEAAEAAMLRAYTALAARPGGLDRPRARTDLLALLTQHARADLPLRAG